MIITDKTKCCACGACREACAVKAISLCADEYGNYYPKINEELCTDCGRCRTVCPMENHSPAGGEKKVYALRLKDAERLKNSASGGAFYAMAAAFLANLGGVVYGCGYGDDLMPVHQAVRSAEGLASLQGSKYARSDVSVYGEILALLKGGTPVLFSGTPCQCTAVKLYCQGYDSKLYTVELVCHGVVDRDYWRDYVGLLETKTKGKILSYSFRSKTSKGNYVARYVSFCGKKEKVRYETPATSYYYNHFLRGNVFRESCYTCPFACSDRRADVTVGDFWGYRGRIDVSKGISMLIANNGKGNELFGLTKPATEWEESSFDAASAKNEQLKKPIGIEKKNYDILKQWKANGARALDRQHRKKHWKADLLSKFGIIR